MTAIFNLAIGQILQFQTLKVGVGEEVLYG